MFIFDVGRLSHKKSTFTIASFLENDFVHFSICYFIENTLLLDRKQSKKESATFVSRHIFIETVAKNRRTLSIGRCSIILLFSLFLYYVNWLDQERLCRWKWRDLLRWGVSLNTILYFSLHWIVTVTKNIFKSKFRRYSDLFSNKNKKWKFQQQKKRWTGNNIGISPWEGRGQTCLHLLNLLIFYRSKHCLQVFIFYRSKHWKQIFLFYRSKQC